MVIYSQKEAVKAMRLTHQANFTLDKNTIRELAEYSKVTGLSKSSIVDIAVSEYIRINRRKNKPCHSHKN